MISTILKNQMKFTAKSTEERTLLNTPSPLLFFKQLITNTAFLIAFYFDLVS
jgi:hypothetical protein